ncbi:hypothetical protein B0H13DRAFT_1895968 [Mycena leptocephala]|nr:hypothetical protein B0H13DRAFT_1895968 [Mycena leptocephala]
MSAEPQTARHAVASSATPPPPPASPTPILNVAVATVAANPTANGTNHSTNGTNHSTNANSTNGEPRPVNELKRKTPPMGSLSEDVKPIILPPGANLPVGEYEAGRVICEVCGGGVSFRDDTGGGAFTLKHWEAHRLTCGGAQHPPTHPHPNGNGNAHPTGSPLVYTPPHSSSASFPNSSHPNASHDGPPLKRRRAKRTEDERIEYLRADAHVAQFEAYRVLCASCDKWIRLRPNSTYCSIPWDAHRKSCLAKKSNAKNVYALEERNAMFAKDPDVRKFDSERILCGMCDKMRTDQCMAQHAPDDHLSAVQVWMQHRATCQKTVSALKNVIYFSSANAAASSSMAADAEERKPVLNASAGPSSSSHRALRPASPNGRGPHSHPQAHPQSHSQAQHPPPPHGHPHSAPPNHRGPHPSTHPPAGPGPQTPTHLPHPDAPHLLLDLSPANYAAPHESRRRNAEQRAATLRADVLIREVEPNRVFCSLCTKWVQLRQDSSYSSREVSGAVSLVSTLFDDPRLPFSSSGVQRRAQKASEIASLKAKRPMPGAGARSDDPHHLHHPSDADEPESEEGVLEPAPASHANAGHQRPRAHTQAHRRHAPAPPNAYPPRAIPAAAVSGRPVAMNAKEWAAQQAQAQMQMQMQGDDVDAEGEADDVDADGDSYMEEDGATPTRGYSGNGNGYNGGASAILRRAVPASLADLDSPGGRRAFVFASVEYLFRTTYEASDDMSVSALLTYLNAAMPTDKHEDFDTGEVVRAASALAAREKERFVLEGDMLRLLHE